MLRKIKLDLGALEILFLASIKWFRKSSTLTDATNVVINLDNIPNIYFLGQKEILRRIYLRRVVTISYLSVIIIYNIARLLALYKSYWAASSYSYALLMLFKLPACIHNAIYARQAWTILKFQILCTEIQHFHWRRKFETNMVNKLALSYLVSLCFWLNKILYYVTHSDTSRNLLVLPVESKEPAFLLLYSSCSHK